ncbi:endonuclease G [Melaminivora alkalimesophila]|uniref:Endonuclease G n=1 Tax=Melaminivora alkalimesophila TaxID=1165852 RepID=A0A317RGX1_9BURK|nr:DNA/RNA non-specific endonuclease [Melaminivora alkalimesophila]PWW49017.1 endonuclease G [Melaminivora alkalimesophila]
MRPRRTPPLRKPTRRRTRPAAPRPPRLAVSFFTACVIAFQLASCGIPVPSPGPAAPPAGALHATAFSECPQFFARGRPPAVPAAPQLRELCYDSFAILHSGQTRTPVLVAQRLNRRMLQQGRHIQRTDRFFADARLPRSERAELQDYRGSGYSRGHMAPAADMPNATAMAQSFSLANVVPQDSRHNSGPWAKVEADTRAYVMRARGDVFVITGPVFEPGAKRIGSNRVAVPSHLFKLVHDPSTGRSWAHWQQNAPSAKVERPISYEELVRRTGANWLPGVR